MEFVYNLFVVLHFVGLAMLLGGFLVQLTAAEKGVNRTMLDGAMTQLVTGIALVGLAKPAGETLNQTAVGIKFTVLLVIVVLALIGRRRPMPQVAFWAAIGVLALVNICVAVFAGMTTS